ncbi:MAG: ABC transporter permease subunit [Candidatus Eisenbacteria bacterium]|nr:ABC transporter permease subunit [Candidatus Latescibacterota bacterium]MBD3302884.1 ABC transporter permease subunit [Candidatus Eisenbacteria bacterium]
MRFGGALLAVLRKDLLRKLRAPLAAVVMILFPVVFSLLIGLVFGGGDLTPIRIALVDDDGGIVGRLIRSSFSQEMIPLRFDVQQVDSLSAIRKIESNEVSAVIRIPPEFTDSLLAGETVALEVIKNPAESIKPQIVEHFASVLARLGSSGMHLLGDPIAEIRATATGDAPPSDAFISDLSVGINRRMEGIGRYAFPPAIELEKPEVEDEAQGESMGAFDVAAFVLPGMAVFALLMLALVSMTDVQREDAHRTLARQMIAPVPAGAVVLGKVGATAVVSLLSILILGIIAAIWIPGRISWLGFLLHSIALALCATGFAALIQSLSRSEKTGSAIGSILVMVMAMVGGSWVPVNMLPEFVRKIAPFTLTYWGGEGYRDLLMESAGVADLVPHVAILLVLGVLFSGTAILRFQRRYAGGG